MRGNEGRQQATGGVGSLAIIPARGGSKRIPRKNIRPFVGKPVIAYSIAAALESELFDEVMVSTEDEEIAEIARSFGARVPFRRSERNAGDQTSTAEVLIEVIDQYARRGCHFQYGCCIYPTAPFVTPESLAKAWRLLVDGCYDSVFPVLRFAHPIQRALRISDDRVSMIWPEYLMARSQDLEPAYHDAGQFYWFSVDALREKQRLWTDNSSAIVLSELDAHDIDTLDDWAAAELKYRLRRERSAS